MHPQEYNLNVFFVKRNLLAGCAASSLLALPAIGVLLAAPAQAQTIIGSNHDATVNLSNYSAGPVLIHSGTAIDAAFGNGIIASTGSFWSLSNAGEVNAPDGAGILLGMAGDVTNQFHGLLTGIDGIELSDGGSVNNAAGAVINAGRYGVLVNGAAGTIANAGAIAAGYDGISLNHGGEVANAAGGTIRGGHIGLYTANGYGSVANAGIISAQNGDAVSLYGGGRFTNTAGGEVIGGYTGVFTGGAGGSIQNAGIITGPDFGIYADGASHITNTGSIAGGVDGIIATGNGGTIVNAGMVTGAKIGLRSCGAANVENSGTITGGLIGAKLGSGSELTNAAGGLIEGGSIGVQAGTNVLVNNAGTVLDKTVAGIVLARGDALNNTGTIGGVVGLLVDGGGASIFNAGLIASTSAGGDAIQLEGGADNLTFSTGSVISGSIDGGGSASQITLAGSGVLSGNLDDFGAGSALDITPGANWAASGTWMMAQVTNSGTFQPGITGTPLDLTGDFTQAASGTMRVLVSPTGTTHFNVTGAVQLAGELEYVLAPGAYVPTTESFLTASGGISGSFASTAHLSPAPAAITPAPIPQVAETQPQIQQQVQQTVQQQTGVVEPQQTQQAVFGLAPAPVTPEVVAAVSDNNNLNLVVTRAFTVAPVDAALFSETNQAMALDAERAGDALLAHASGSAAPCVSGTLPGGANIATALASGFCQAGGWITATGTRMTEANAFGASNAGFLAGIDRQVANARLGLAVGYDETSLTDKSAGKASVDTMRIGLYGALPLGRLTLSGDVMDGLATTRTTRQTGAGAAGARNSGNVLGGAVQVALPAAFGSVSLLPMAGVQFANVSQGNFTENSADPAFAVSGAAYGGVSARPYLRLAVSQDFATASQLVITPAASLGVTYQTSQRAVHLTSQGGTSFAARAPALDGTAGEVSAGISASQGGLSLSAKYSALLAGNWSSQTVEASLDVKF